MIDFWYPTSGKYAGYSNGDDFFNHKGKHVGIFKELTLHSSKSGRPIAKIVNSHYLARHTQGATIGIYSRGFSSSRNLASRVCLGGYQDPDLD